MEKFKKIVDVDDGNKKGNTALHLAVLRGDIEEVEKLALNPINVKTKNNEGKTAFHLAVLRGDIKAAEILANMRYRIEGDTALHHAICINHTNEAIRLINAGANLDAQSLDQRDSTPLHMAVLRENIEVIEALIEAGAEKNVRNRDAYTPLDLAYMLAEIPNGKNKKEQKRIKEIISSLESSGAERSKESEKKEVEEEKHRSFLKSFCPCDGPIRLFTRNERK